MTAVQILPLFAAISFAAPIAAPAPAALTPMIDSVDQILLANRLRGYRFNVRPSRYRRGAFSRGDCPVDAQEQLQAIVPDLANMDDIDLAAPETGTTVIGEIPAYLNAAAHPVFLLHAPALENASGILFVEIPTLSVQERQQYKVGFDLSDRAGIIAVKMPTTAPALEVGKSYRWRVSVECSPNDEELDTINFRSAVYEQMPDVVGDEQARLSHYLEQGIWQDTAAIIAEERYDNAHNEVDEEWAYLMETSGLPQFADVSIIDIQTGQLLID
jgi:hypothetical protein